MAKIDGIQNIQTDTKNRVCSFEVTDPELDYQSQLVEFAKTNDHLAGYSIK